MTEYEFIQAEKASFPVRANVQSGRSLEVRLLRANRSWPIPETATSRGTVEEGHVGARVLAAYVRQPPGPRSAGTARRGRLREDGGLGDARNRLVARPRGAFRVTTDSRFTEYVAPNLLDRDSTHPNDVWVTDVTTLPILGAWVFPASIIDLYARRVAGCALSKSNDTDLAT